MRVLITGATGFIGAELLRAYASATGISRLGVVIRPDVNNTSQQRLKKIKKTWQDYGLWREQGNQLSIDLIDGDLFSLNPHDLSGWDIVVHTAASTDLGMPLGEARRSNVLATQCLLQSLRRAGFSGRFVHFSTAYVAGTRRGLVHENDSPRRFNNHYERSKWESEDAVRQSGFAYTILRPSIVVGRSDSGYVTRMKVLYSVWRAWLLGVLPRAPIDRESLVDIVPVDYVVDATVALATLPAAEGQTLHLCSGLQCARVGEILDAAVSTFQVNPPKLLAPIWVKLLDKWPLRRFVSPSILELLHKMYWHLPYLGTRGRVFDMTHTDRLLADHKLKCPAFKDYGQRMWGFCRETSWGKRPQKCA